MFCRPGRKIVVILANFRLDSELHIDKNPTLLAGFLADNDNAHDRLPAFSRDLETINAITDMAKGKLPIIVSQRSYDFLVLSPIPDFDQYSRALRPFVTVYDSYPSFNFTYDKGLLDLIDNVLHVRLIKAIQAAGFDGGSPLSRSEPRVMLISEAWIP